MSIKKFGLEGTFKCRKCKHKFTEGDLKEFVIDTRFLFYKCLCKKVNLISKRELSLPTATVNKISK